ncbi:MAG: AMP-binding protein [Clostridia bacterium]|nr:AMP-binding protein [Clostridia bacterium]
MSEAQVKAPWLSSYGVVPHTLEYAKGSMSQNLFDTAHRLPDNVAYEFQGFETTFKEFEEQIHLAAKALYAWGIREGDAVTICMPNCPQAIITFYAINVIGAVANMIHPLSSEGEIAFYLEDSKSVCALTLQQFYPKFVAVKKKYPLQKLIVTSISDALSGVLKIGYNLTSGRKINKMAPIPENDPSVIWWNDFLKLGKKLLGNYECHKKPSDVAVILYSGGTTGKTKGILLSNLNFNALALQTVSMGNCFFEGAKMLAVMPIFHGFGLGVSIHTALCAGGTCILVPQVNVKLYSKLLRTKQPNVIAGVPTLFEGILRNPDMEGVDLSCLTGVFSGGDSLSIELKKKFDKFLLEHRASVRIREGYGMTECVTASCLTPYHIEREGSIGLPFPDTFYKIVKVGTTEEAPYGEEGEMCISGPSVMIGYAGLPEETAATLRTHADGRVWLHSGDLGMMDSDGFIYFKQRAKRMIISSGYNIYPSQLENVIDGHKSVQMSCCIGVPDPYKMQKVKAFVMLRPGVKNTPEVIESIRAHCKKNIAKYAMPYEFEIRENLPKTLVGKVAYRELEAEEEAKRKAAEADAANQQA